MALRQKPAAYLAREAKRPANRLFRVMALLSIAVHAVLLFHLAEVYSSNNLSVIELSLEDVSRPEMRDIPTPRPRPKKPPESQEIARPRTRPRPLPAFKPMKAEPARAELPDSLMERIGVPDLPDAPGIPATELDPKAFANAGGGEFGTPRDYLDLVRMRIESKKEYPGSARKENREGRVTLRFTIISDGKPDRVRIWRSSEDRRLDRAALQAVRDAAPFPPPPGRFFQADVPVELTIVFELT